MLLFREKSCKCWSCNVWANELMRHWIWLPKEALGSSAGRVSRETWEYVWSHQANILGGGILCCSVMYPFKNVDIACSVLFLFFWFHFWVRESKTHVSFFPLCNIGIKLCITCVYFNEMQAASWLQGCCWNYIPGQKWQVEAEAWAALERTCFVAPLGVIQSWVRCEAKIQGSGRRRN